MGTQNTSLKQREQKMFTLAASSSTVVVAGRISSSSSTSSSSKTSASIPSLGGGLISKNSKTNNFVSFHKSSSTQKQQKRGTRENVVIRATENEEDEYMFKPTANAGGKGGVLDRDNPLLEEKFAVIGDGEHECQSCMYQYSPTKGTTSIQSPRERRLKTCQKTGTARCAARPSQSSNPSADKSLASNKTKVTGLERTV